MNTKYLIKTFAALFLFGAVVFAVRFGLGGSEDTWLCQQGQWIKHGHPVAPMPRSGCGEIEAEKGFAEPQQEASPAGLANPAAVKCEEEGGTLRYEQNETGIRGICVFEDGIECDEWEFFQGQCPATASGIVPRM